MDAEAIENLRQAGGLPEGIGQIADHHALAEGFAVELAVEQIAHDGLAADHHFIGLSVPRSNDQTAVAHQLGKTIAIFRTERQIILQNGGLTV